MTALRRRVQKCLASIVALLEVSVGFEELGDGRDLTDAEYEAALRAPFMSCEYDDDVVEATLIVNLVALRGPADEDGHALVLEHVADELAAAGAAPEADGDAVDPANPMLTVEGTECPERVIVVAAGVGAPEGSPGANRNGSGVAALLESARIIAEQPLPASVSFVAVPPGSGGAEAVLGELPDGSTAQAWIDLDGVGVTSGDEDSFLAVEHAYLLMATDADDDYLARVSALSTASFLPGFWAWGAVFPEERRDDLGVRESIAADEDLPTLVFSDGGKWRDERVGTEEDVVDLIDIEFLANSARAVLASLVGLTTIDNDGDAVPDICANP